MSTHKVMGSVLWEALNAKRERCNMSWRDLARTLDLSGSTFPRLKDPQAGIHADALVSMLAWLGTDQRFFTVLVKIPEGVRNDEPPPW
jgi:hypothetical protein